jgi:hypothetical protein
VPVNATFKFVYCIEIKGQIYSPFFVSLKIEHTLYNLHAVCLSGCSFASGGDSDSLDYIAYVAKDNAGIALLTHSCWLFMYSSTDT